MKTPLAQAEFLQFRALGNGQPVHGTFFYHYARLIETLAGVEEAAMYLQDPEVTGTHLQTHGRWNNATGIGASEAPRGTLFHHYETDDSGKLTMVNLLIATGQNNPSMNRSITDVARQYVHGADVAEGMLNRVESAIRCYDPCLSCSTHAMGKMPMQIDIVDAGGEVLRSLQR
jgi:NAD-reducing hydrogenase large subunit